jgi:3-oxoacyl-[acyl-carrier protein] reductase
MKKILLVGASSDIAQSLINQYGDVYKFTTLSREFHDSFRETDFHQIHNFDELPELTTHLDGLVYFPGTIVLKPFKLLKVDDFKNDFEINFFGAIKVIQKYIRNMQNKDASVVLFSSVAATMGMPFHSSIASAKAAIEGLTRSLAAEYAPQIRFNAIAPSLTETKLASRLINTPEKIEASNHRHPMKRIGSPSDFANAIHYLLSNESSWMTGQILHIDGGMSSIKL